MECDDCLEAERHGRSRLYSPACLHCGGRYLRAIQRLWIPEADKRAWLRKALADWMQHGHGEQELRELAAPKKTPAPTPPPQESPDGH